MFISTSIVPRHLKVKVKVKVKAKLDYFLFLQALYKICQRLFH